MTKKSTPKQIADEMETEQNYPVLNKYNKIAKAVDRMDEGPGKQVARGAVLAGTVPAGVAQIGHSLITGKRGRSKEDTDELEREIGRGQRAEKKAKGGDVQSESSKLDQKNAKMDKEQEEGFKRYQAEQAKEAKENADSRKSMPFFNFGKPEKKAKGGAIKSSASSRGDGCAQRGKTKGRMV